MIEDDVMGEVRAAREAYAKLHNFDVRAMAADLRVRDLGGDWQVVSMPPRRPCAVPTPMVAPNDTHYGKLELPMTSDPNDTIRRLVDHWCDRKFFKPLALVLPAWTTNNGLTDGWVTLHDALEHAYATCTDLPPDERDALKQAFVAIDGALRNR